MTSQDDLTERYGAPSPLRRRTLLVGVGLVGALFLGWLTWTALAHAEPEVSSAMQTYSIDGEHAATARVAVRLESDDVVATCLLRATSEDHTVVGELSFEVTADDVANTATLERTVRTERRATSLELIGCTTPDQGRPR